MMRQVSSPVRRRAGRKGRKDLARSLSCNKATCLSLLSNAALVWNTVQMSRIVEQLRASGETITEEELARISPLAFSHIIPNGTYFSQRVSRAPSEESNGHRSPGGVEGVLDV